MAFSHAVILYDAVLLGVIGADFIAFSRRNDNIVAKAPALAMLAALIALALEIPGRRIEFVTLGLVTAGAAMFGYANFLAFVKRGVTFSILANHARPRHDRLADDEFIAIDERLHELRGHGWAAERGGRWQLTPAGRRVARARRLVMQWLRIEAVG